MPLTAPRRALRRAQVPRPVLDGGSRVSYLGAMGLAFLTRIVTFAAAHRYSRQEWSEEQNRAVFGACANPHGHGHNYRLEVTVQAPIDADTGFSADLAQLDGVLRDEVVRPLDHQHLNHAVPEFAAGVVPTCENILAWLWPRIAGRLGSGERLYRLRLHEDDRLFVDYFGGAPP
jgi:6-pyruvoyltetrahydropterin/6-carboxytetrahydropterin synthase